MAFVFSKNGPQGGIKFNLPDSTFDKQPAIDLLPKSLISPIEMLVSMCVCDTNDAVKEIIIALLIETCAHRLEQFILQVNSVSILCTVAPSDSFFC